MTAAKQIKIPNWVQSVPAEVSIAPEELRSREGSYQYVMIAESDTSLDLIAAPHAKDVPFFAAYFKTFKGSEVEPGKRMFFHGRIMDPDNLPYEIEAGQHVFVLFEDWFIQVFETMAKAVEFINDMFARCSVDDTSNLMVIIGHNYGEGVLAAVNAHVEKLEKDLWG